jgi:mRNA interferase MazF
VVSSDLFNKATGLCIACPVTGSRRDFPFIPRIAPGREAVGGVVMVEQVKSIDYRARSVKRIGAAPEPILEEVLSISGACIY